MRILFMGTPQFAAASLEAMIHSGLLEIAGVVTQPDRPKGRGMNLQPSEVKVVALRNNLQLWQPEQVESPDFLQVFDRIAPDAVVVVAFGQKIPSPILIQPKFGCINVHGSLLPKYRGAAPIQWSIINGDEYTGVTTMYMDEGWDTGDIIYQRTLTIDPNENFRGLYHQMAKLGGELLVSTLLDIESGIAPRIQQDHSQATKAPKIKPEMERIQWTSPARLIHNIVRVFAPTPGAETFLENERLKIIDTRIAAPGETIQGCPGQIIEIVKNEGIYIQTGDQLLLVTLIQPVGKKVMSANDFANGRHIKPGMIFEEKD